MKKEDLDDMSYVFSFFVWEIMHSTIKKMNKHVTKLQKEVEEARDKMEAVQRRVGYNYIVHK